MLKKNAASAQRYELGADVSRPKQVASIPRTAHLAIIGESNSGKGSVIVNIIRQEVKAGGEIWFIDLESGMEAENYVSVLDNKAYSLQEAKEIFSPLSTWTWTHEPNVGAGKSAPTVDDQHERHRLLVIDEAADLIRSGSDKKTSDACVKSIRSALSRSRALNCTLVAATQNPRVNTSLPYRSLLLTTLALRLNSKSEAVMVLGEDAVQRGARPWQISYNRPGDGYL